MSTGEKQVILIIDDKTANIYALETLLERNDRSFISATNGRDGLKLALNEDVDLIILDVQMPEMDGFEVAQMLQSHKRTKEIPIIFASAEKKEKQSVIKGFEEGAVDYLSKPLDPELTKAKVSVLLKIQSQKKELIEKNISLKAAENQIRQLNAELNKNVIDLEEANKELESFSYSVSHDLRAPLRSLMGYSAALLEDYNKILDDNGKKMLGVIERNASRMDDLINDLLAFSRLGKQSVEKSDVSTGRLVKGVIREITEANQYSARIDISELQDVYADAPLLNQVWVNLISNALKYSSKKSEPRVEIGSLSDEDEDVFFVKDNGAGFNMEYASKLFNVFQRLHKPSDFEGTGIGLALVHRIIKKHGGRVWAEGKVNEGATFYFSLPKKAEVAQTVER